MHCHNCGRPMRAPAMSVTREQFDPGAGRKLPVTLNYGPRCAAKIVPQTPERRRSERARIAAPFRRPRTTQAEADPRQMALEGMAA